MERLLQAVDGALKAFGAPGDWGYGTPMGDALLELYRARAQSEPTISRVLREAAEGGWRPIPSTPSPEPATHSLEGDR